MRPLKVYLDSSDFSSLSDPRQLARGLDSILQFLRQSINDGRIKCYYSATHICEMAPLQAAYADASQRRADLLVELCGRNAMVSQDVLFDAELSYALDSSAPRPQIIAPEGDWFPDGLEDISPTGMQQFGASLQESIGDMNLNRKARRLADRKAFKRGKPRAALRNAAVSNARYGSLAEMLQIYPMRPQDARVLSRYAVGDATPAEATAALRESLRDPHWMMLWFEKHHAKLTPFIDWVRSPAVEMKKNLDEMALQATSMRQLDLTFGTNFAEDYFASLKWAEMQEELLVRIAIRLSQPLGRSGQELTSLIIDERCPGLSVGVRSLHSAWRSTTFTAPRKVKLSDFPDALHAMYAPYVDIFRADSFMAPLIQKHSHKFGTTIVSKVIGLPHAIELAFQVLAGDTQSDSLDSA